jgi:hypothetical protein
VVREYDSAPNPDLLLVVEPWLPADPTQQQRADLEAALSLAATIAVSWCRVYGTWVTLVVAGDSESPRTATPNDRGIRVALTPLADLEGSDASASLNGIVFNRSFARSARIIVSSRPNTPSASLITRATGRLFLAVSPADRLPWYLPPSSLKQNREGAAGLS